MARVKEGESAATMQEEEATQSSTASPTESSPCPICLRPMLQDSYLDQCFHRFCYNCILRWTKIVANKHSHRPSSVKCPLCKSENLSIVYGYDGSSFQQHYVNQDLGDSFVLSRAHKYRLQCYYTEQGLLNDTFNVSRYWKGRKYLQPNCWVQAWLRRELQALMQEEDVDVILHHIEGTFGSFLRSNEQKLQIKAPDTRQEEFKELICNAARPFLIARTERFVLEMEKFIASGLNIDAYDKVYIQKLGWDSREDSTDAVEGEEHVPVIPYMHIFDAETD